MNFDDCDHESETNFGWITYFLMELIGLMSWEWAPNDDFLREDLQQVWKTDEKQLVEFFD